MPTDDLLRCSSKGVRVRRWKDRDDIAHLTPLGEPGSLQHHHIDEIVDCLVSTGITGVLSAAVGPAEEAVFREAGFRVHERLLLLRHDLENLDPVTIENLRRASWRQRDQVLAVDNRAFDGFWQLDATGLLDAVRATPQSRFRTSHGSEGQVTGYAITGRAGTSGFVQRLAVDPGQQGNALGRNLVLDGLHWLRRRGARQAFVNTQHINARAAELYRRVGFRAEDHDLAVLSWGEAP